MLVFTYLHSSGATETRTGKQKQDKEDKVRIKGAMLIPQRKQLTGHHQDSLLNEVLESFSTENIKFNL